MASNGEKEKFSLRIELKRRHKRRKPVKQQNAEIADSPAIRHNNPTQGSASNIVGSTPIPSTTSLDCPPTQSPDEAPEPVPATVESDHQNVNLIQEGLSQLTFAETGCPVRIDQLSYDVPASSGKIWRFHHSSIYVAPAEELLSQPMMAKWDHFITSFQANFTLVKDKMIADQCRNRRLRQEGSNLTRFMLEVRVSGRRQRFSQSIQMGPCLWILCGSKWCQKRICEVAKDLTLPVDLSLQRIEVHTGLPIPNALRIIVPLSRLPIGNTTKSGLHHNGGNILYHIEGRALESGRVSACGLLCCATYVKDGEVIEQHISRIGGILTFSKKDDQSRSLRAAITTAHGVFDHLWSLNDGEGKEDNEIEDEELSSGSDFCGSEPDEAPMSYTENLSMVGDIAASDVESWVPLKAHAARYLDRRLPESSLENEGASAPADYAILGSHVLQRFQNVVDSTSSTTITTHARNDELKEGSLLLLLGPGNNSEATLLPGSLKLPMGDSEVAVRKIRLKAPLGTYDDDDLSIVETFETDVA